MIYAGAQKNVGPSGMAVVIVRQDLIERAPAGLPVLLDYRVMAENDSLYNTPPSFGIYIVSLVTQWLIEEIGGLGKMEAINIEKAKRLYAVIDGSGGYYRGHAVPECRSRMNVTFRLPDETLEARFVSQAKEAGMHELKGHRSVGGCRASIYNAMPLEGVQALCDFMVDFQKNNG
jgi:phosphoserine aminotransferase